MQFSSNEPLQIFKLQPQNITQGAPKVKYSSPLQLRYPQFRLFSQQRYFELGPEKLELSYFPNSYAIFSPQLRYFSPPVALFSSFSPPVTLENSVTGGKKKKIA